MGIVIVSLALVLALVVGVVSHSRSETNSTQTVEENSPLDGALQIKPSNPQTGGKTNLTLAKQDAHRHVLALEASLQAGEISIADAQAELEKIRGDVLAIYDRSSPLLLPEKTKLAVSFDNLMQAIRTQSESVPELFAVVSAQLSTGVHPELR